MCMEVEGGGFAHLLSTQSVQDKNAQHGNFVNKS